MSGRLPDAFIEELLSRTDIVDVIERRVSLKRAGNEWHALCPFHDEKSPSFTVSPTKQFYHCFGCGAHGSAIGFMMQFEGLEFRDAVEDLAKAAGMQVPQAEGAPRPRPRPRTGLFEMMERASDWFQSQLKAHPPAVEYLKQRGLTGEICAEFGIGYAPAGWDGLMKALGGDGTRDGLLRRAGLLSDGNKGSYDKFRDRVIFPIHDRRGRVIAFGGRAISDDGPKYLNSPETELFHKGRELYGLYLARKRGRLDSVLVVEGYMDVVALAQFGFGNAVATLGTATTPDQAGLLLRATDTVVYCFDGDEAGRKAAWKALRATLPKLSGGKQARFLFLPDGEDPDSMVRKLGREKFEKLLGFAQPLSDFFFDHLTAEVDMESLDGRAKLVQLARPYLDTLPAGVFRDMMMERLESLARYHLRESGHARKARPDAPKPRPVKDQGRTPMRLALAHLVQNPALGRAAGDLTDLLGSDMAGADLLLELVDICRERPNMTTAQMLESLRSHPSHDHLAKLAIWDLPGDEETSAREFLDAIDRLRLKRVEEALAALPRIIDQDDGQKADYMTLQRQAAALKDRLRGRGK